jgi:hypothetical protein
MDLGGWLRSLGLEQYEAAFRENAIDDSVLPSLTAEDLKELGVDAVGHRRKLLNAIAALRAEPNAKATSSDFDTSAKESAERRLLTVMFVDRVGSTALGARLDPEDLRDVIAAYHGCVTSCRRNRRRVGTGPGRLVHRTSGRPLRRIPGNRISLSAARQPVWR